MRRRFNHIHFLLGACATLCVTRGTFAQVDTGRVAGLPTRNAAPGLQTPFTIELKGAELKECLRFLARIAGYNVMIPEGVTGIVNASFDAAPVIDAINSIVKANGLDFAVERGILRVGKAEQFTTSGEDLKAETIRLKFANAKQMAEKVKGLLTSRGSVLADERTNALVVRETLANIEHVRHFLENIDIRDAQVLIAAKLVEATRDWSRSLGIQWGVTTDSNPRGNVAGVAAAGRSDGGRNLMVNLPASNTSSGFAFLVGKIVGGTNIDLQITAAEQKGDLHVISEPQIVTSNGIPAKIRSGETIYVKTAGSVSIGATSAAGSGQTGLQSIETGVELNVTPQISVGGFVQMMISATSSSPDFTRQVDGIPAIIDNKASTSVVVRDGETTVIGGLMKWRQQDQRRRTPYLSEIPLLGNLFKSRTRQRLNTELMIFIRPMIVDSDYVASPMMYELPRVEEVKRDTTVADQPHKKRERPPRQGPLRTPTKQPKSWERTKPMPPMDGTGTW